VETLLDSGDRRRRVYSPTTSGDWLGNGILLALVRSCMNRLALDDERLELDSDSSVALSSGAEGE
jgi:hypothetical protein